MHSIILFIVGKKIEELFIFSNVCKIIDSTYMMNQPTYISNLSNGTTLSNLSKLLVAKHVDQF